MHRSPLSYLALASLLASCQPAPTPPPDESAAAAEAVRAADAAWEKALSGRDINASVAAVDPTGSVLPAGDLIATGPDSIRAAFTGLFTLPGMDLHWTATRVEGARSGELGYSSGTYTLGFNDPKGKPATEHGKYVTVWRKQADGSWKVLLDIWNADPPVK